MLLDRLDHGGFCPTAYWHLPTAPLASIALATEAANFPLLSP
jgi:hypothetical protein